ncbi:VWA domain-containing protein [uncultured Tenacibaculum sp.]|uniref:vWA domain-containing protein n=1 Tax=uncultured Tenacibaculum sp. TaxID=174713 RepID=UPI00261B2D9C|nr:VWA domain-containing protein [uncultured Tenacibaculum sp.]
MRRLPVYLLLDTSASMTGEPIEAVKKGIQFMIDSLKQDPQAIETAFVSIITFDSSVKQLMPLTDVISFQIPEITAKGTTALGEALDLVSYYIDTEVEKTTPLSKGDWKPLVFIMTDGVPTDDIQQGITEIKKRNIGQIVACAAGSRANTELLKQITKNVIRLETADAKSISNFFAWVTASIGIASTKIEEKGEDTSNFNDFPPPADLDIIL